MGCKPKRIPCKVTGSPSSLQIKTIVHSQVSLCTETGAQLSQRRKCELVHSLQMWALLFSHCH